MEWFPNFRSNPAFKSLLSGAHSAVGKTNTDADSENSERPPCGLREAQGIGARGALGTGWTGKSGLRGGLPIPGEHFCRQWKEQERIGRPVLRAAL